MMEMSFRNVQGSISSVIHRPVRKLALGTLVFLLKYSDHFRPLQTTSISLVKLLQVPKAASTNHFKPLQLNSDEMLGIIKGSIIVYMSEVASLVRPVVP